MTVLAQYLIDNPISDQEVIIAWNTADVRHTDPSLVNPLSQAIIDELTIAKVWTQEVADRLSQVGVYFTSRARDWFGRDLIQGDIDAARVEIKKQALSKELEGKATRVKAKIDDGSIPDSAALVSEFAK